MSGVPSLRERWIAPWTDDQVEALNAMQADGSFHGYTCPGERECLKFGRTLTATRDGWICVCGLYRRTWAHAVPTPVREIAATTEQRR